MSRRLSRTAGAIAALALAAALAAPAQAATAAAAPAAHRASTAFGPAATGQHNARTPHTRYDGGVWGGYVAQGSGFQSISGSWTMPQIQCNTSNDLFAPWVGIDGYGSQTVEQTGVQADCSSGSPVLSGWYEMYPAPPQFFNDPVSAGDSFTGTVTTDGSGTYSLALTDNTQGWTENTQQQLDAQNVSAEAVIESPSQSYPSFDRLDFSGVTVNGQPFDAFGPQAIDSGQYTETALQNGSFSIVPSGAGQNVAHRTPSAVARPAVPRY
ncbi:G1 family glutamic endopeptidase [Kitasatospora mediocidica]|uniref:G1 family glutamic endopeptidase n=1 Tax=Kitasatospora mediocidica TaxID=58352 RepID=UPI00068FEE1E|nr:G1 family glutamic endopeptidase [Kitasatospora mediocidica]